MDLGKLPISARYGSTFAGAFGGHGYGRTKLYFWHDEGLIGADSYRVRMS